jgi:hypothetical protein
MKLNYTVMKTGIATISNRKYKRNEESFDRFYIYIPVSVAKDSAFPFADGEKINITIENESTIKLEKIST